MGLMSAKIYKLACKIVSLYPKLESIEHEPLEFFEDDQDRFNKCIFRSCKILHAQADFTVRDLIPSNFLEKFLSEIKRQQALESEDSSINRRKDIIGWCETFCWRTV